MLTTQVSKLKASLSEYLLKVKGGQEIIITERGKPIAKIIPIEQGKDKIAARISDLEKRGIIRRGTKKLPRNFWRISRPKDITNRALHFLLKEREDSL